MTQLAQRQEAGVRAHWEEVYSTKRETEVSWYQDKPTLSLALICEAARGTAARVIDVGGGASVLVDRLLGLGFPSPSVLDISEAALDQAKTRLGQAASQVTWLAGDITKVGVLGSFDVWHDRAVFHFLTLEEDRQAYLSLAARSIPAGGHLVLATFALDGPECCSGLSVCRYDAASLARAFVPFFRLVQAAEETHSTPWGASQKFVYCLFRRESR
ncbi:MAG: SAM-dependent methyltransferase [Armatimonadetes bacterium]|jgi:SAM-dependent methyltransferase|nr:SAM-dependent methyltransferase [Armatimonadota bacterium]